jgi:hypothetical protein
VAAQIDAAYHVLTPLLGRAAAGLFLLTLRRPVTVIPAL